MSVTDHLLKSSILPVLLALLGSAPAAADTITTRGGGGPLEGKVVQESATELVVESDGWQVTVKLPRVLAVRKAGGAWRIPLVDRFEDQALAHGAQGRYQAAYVAYKQALAALVASQRGGAISAAESAGLGEFLLRRLHSFALYTGRSGEAARTFFAVANGKGMLTPLCRDLARTFLVSHLRRLGRNAWAKKDLARLGVVSSFFIVGAFDNERGTGFDKAYPPEAKPFDPAATFKGKAFPVGWRPQPISNPPYGIIDLDALCRPSDQALAYAITYLHAERATRVALRIGSDEALKVWVNRTLVHRNKLRRSFNHDQDHVGVVLKPGWNEVLLKVCDQTGGWKFRMRVTTPWGGPAHGVRAATLAEIASKPKFTRGARKAPVRTGGLDALLAATKLPGATWRDWFHLGYVHFGRRAHDETKHPDRLAFRRAAKLAPNNAVLQVFLSHTLGGSGEYSINQEFNARRQALEKAVALDPKHHGARWRLASYYADRLGNADRARALLAPILQSNPGFLGPQLLSLRLDRGRGLGPLAGARLRKLMDEAEGRIQREEALKYPASLLYAALSAATARGDVRRQLELCDHLLEIDRDDVATLSRVARLHRAAGRARMAELLYRRAIGISPYRADLHVTLSRLLEASNDHSGARKELEAALKIAPDDESLVTALGFLHERMRNGKQAMSLFKRALVLNPKLVDLKKYLRYRSRHKKRVKPFEDAWAVDPRPLIKKSRAIPLNPRLTHRYLLRQEVAKVNPDGTQSEWIQEVFRVESRQGVRGLAWYSAYYKTDQQVEFQRARVYRKGGGVEDAPVGTARGYRGGEFTSTRRYPVRFPPLEVGDVIEVRYRVDDLEQGFFGDYYGKVAYFQSQQPIDWMRYVLIAPKVREFHFHTPGMGGLKPTRVADEKQGTTAYVFAKKGIKALESEPNQPWAKEIVPQVQVSTFKDWNSFSKWYWGLVESQHEADAAIKQKVVELTRGAKTTEDKIRRIYNYVVTDIRYNASWEFGIHGFKPYNATKIYARKFGDCKDKSTLINVMLKEIGINSYPVLIFGEDGRGKEDLTLPLMRHFNHCISWVDYGKGGIFLDGTAEHHPYRSLPTMDYGAKVVVVTPKAGVVRNIPFRSPEWNHIKERHTVKLLESGAARVTSVLMGSGTFEVVLRSWLSTKGRRKEVLEPRIGRSFTGARVKSVKTSDLKNLDQKVKVTIDVELPKMLRKTSGGDLELSVIRSWMFDLIYLGGSKVSGLAADTKRTRDVVLPVPSGVEEEIIYELPKGYRVRSLPKPTQLDTTFGRYELIYTREGGKLKVKRVLRFKVNRIPLKQYPAFRKFVEQIDQAESEKPILGKGTDQ